MTIKELLQKIIDKTDNKTLLCRVVNVNADYTATVEPLNEYPSLNDVRLTAKLQSQRGFILVPKNNSIVCVAFADNYPFITLTSEIQDIIIAIDGKITLKNNTENFGKLIVDLISAIERLTVTTAVGPSGTPINIAEFTTIKNRFKNLLNIN
ncbi:MAG: hypothetical protein ABIK31_06020 [candidate division WOR-3 bacterium]